MTTAFADATSQAQSLLIQPDGRIAVTGYFIPGTAPNDYRIATIRYTGDLVQNYRAPFDFDGDSKTDIAIFRSSLAEWWILKSTGGIKAVQFGSSGDKAAPGDYTGDGKTDIAFWRASTGVWYIYRSSDNGVTYASLGSNGDVASPGDYDGDGKADIGVWRNSNSTFYSIHSSNAAVQTIAFSQTSTEPVSADYDGDGKADYAIRNANNWIIRSSTAGNAVTQTPWQTVDDLAVHNDYDGDGKVDIAVWRGAESSPDANDVGRWYIRKSSNGQPRQESWGITGDIPVPAFYRR